MKRFILVSAMFLVAFGSYAYAATEETTNKEVTTTTKEEVPAKEVPAKQEVKSDESRNTVFQVLVGPMIGIKDWGPNRFALGAAFGGKYLRFGLEYARGGSMNTYRPFALLDIPFSFGPFAIGPIVDVGPSFGFVNGTKVIDVMMVGFGLDIKFYFSDMVGVSLSPIHFSNSFTTYTSGGTGWTKGYRLSYDLLFSLILRF